MLKKGNKLISKLLFLTMCTSLLPTTIVFAEEENVTSVIQTTNSAVSAEEKTTIEDVANSESDFSFDANIGTIKKQLVSYGIDGSGQSATCLVSSISYTEVGENIVQISLYSNPSTGYGWKYIPYQGGIIEEASKNFIRANVPVENVGCDGADVWTFKGLKIGSTTVKFEYLQSWVGEEIETYFFLFTVDKELKVTVKEITANEVLGNLNSDNKIDILDYILLKNYIIGNSNSINTQKADINQDSKINILDLLLLKKLI